MRAVVPFIAFLSFWSVAVPYERTDIVLITFKAEGFHNAFWDTLRVGAEASARESGFGLVVRGIPPERMAEAAAAQADLMREAADSGAAGIVVTPIDRYRLAPAVKYAALRGVPVVALDSPIESVLLAGIALTNSYEGGLAAAEEMAALCGGAGEVVMLAHPSRENKATLDREQAFAVGIERFSGGRMRLVGGISSGDGTADGDYRAALALLDAFPDARGAYGVYGGGFLALLRALRERGRAGRVFLIGWDADAETLRALERGEAHGIMQQDAELMARTGVGMIAVARAGRPERRRVGIPATLITARDLGGQEARRLLAPVGSVGAGAPR